MPVNNKHTSYKVAVGGVVSALCLTLMFLTGVFPLLSMAIPIYAGALMIVVAREVSTSWAFAAYCAVSLLSLFLTPDKAAADMLQAGSFQRSHYHMVQAHCAYNGRLRFLRGFCFPGRICGGCRYGVHKSGVCPLRLYHKNDRKRLCKLVQTYVFRQEKAKAAKQKRS